MDKEQLKEMFSDGKRPTGADFAALIDALWANVEEQLSSAMRVQQVKWARAERPEEFDPSKGEVWYDTYSNMLKGRISYPPRNGWVYVIEDSTEMAVGQYVCKNGRLELI